jgi:hypothetical protein
MKRNITSLVEHHKVYNGKKRYKETILTYYKGYPWPCMKTIIMIFLIIH